MGVATDRDFSALQPQDAASVATEGQPISNARLAAELQAVALATHMFGLGHLANMLQRHAYETPETEQVQP